MLCSPPFIFYFLGFSGINCLLVPLWLPPTALHMETMRTQRSAETMEAIYNKLWECVISVNQPTWVVQSDSLENTLRNSKLLIAQHHQYFLSGYMLQNFIQSCENIIAISNLKQLKSKLWGSGDWETISLQWIRITGMTHLIQSYPSNELREVVNIRFIYQQV